MQELRSNGNYRYFVIHSRTYRDEELNIHCCYKSGCGGHCVEVVDCDMTWLGMMFWLNKKQLRTTDWRCSSNCGCGCYAVVGGWILVEWVVEVVECGHSN